MREGQLSDGAPGTTIAVKMAEVIMKLAASESVAAGRVRRVLTVRGDFRSDDAFENDINALLARMEDIAVPFRSVAGLASYSVGWVERGPFLPSAAACAAEELQSTSPAEVA